MHVILYFNLKIMSLRLYLNSKNISSGLLCDNLYKLCLVYLFLEFLSSLNITNGKCGIKRNHDGEYSLKLWHCGFDHISRDRIQCLIKITLDFFFDNYIECIKAKFVKRNKKRTI
jgi:hypothetical protein